MVAVRIKRQVKAGRQIPQNLQSSLTVTGVGESRNDRSCQAYSRCPLGQLKNGGSNHRNRKIQSSNSFGKDLMNLSYRHAEFQVPVTHVRISNGQLGNGGLLWSSLGQRCRQEIQHIVVGGKEILDQEDSWARNKAPEKAHMFREQNEVGLKKERWRRNNQRNG